MAPEVYHKTPDVEERISLKMTENKKMSHVGLPDAN